MILRRITALPAAVIAGLAFATVACGSDEPAEEHLYPDAVYDVTYHDETVVLDARLVGRHLLESDPAAGEYRFERGVREVERLRAGDPLVVTGAGIGIVRSVREVGGQVVVQTDDATLADIIRDGTIAWDYEVTWDDLADSFAELEREAREAGMLVFEWNGGSGAGPTRYVALADGGFALYQTGAPSGAPKITTKFEGSGYDVTLSLEPKGEQLHVQITAKDLRDMVAIQATGWISTFTYSTEINYAEGVARSMTSETRGLRGEMEVQWAAYRTPQVAVVDIARISWPLSLRFPIPGPWPVPMFAELKSAIRIVPELSAHEASSGGKWKVTYQSDQGFRVSEQADSPTGTLHSREMGISGDTVTAGWGPAGFGVGIEFPRLELRVAGKGPSVFITVDTYVAGMWTPGTTLTAHIPPCQTSFMDIKAIAGYQLTVFGFGVTGQKELWRERLDRYKDNVPCTLTGD